MSRASVHSQNILFSDASGGTDRFEHSDLQAHDESSLDDSFDIVESLPNDADLENPTMTPTRQSMYVELLQDMIIVVCETDGHLFTDEEKVALSKWRALDYHARFLLARLALRKEGKLHHFESLQVYKRELRSPDNILSAIEKLCTGVHESGSPEVTLKAEGEPDVIDLTMSDDDDAVLQVMSLESLLPFAHDEGYYDDEEIYTLLDCLKLDDLKSICRSIKVKPISSKRSDHISAILNNAEKQSTLPYRPINLARPILGKRKSFSSPRVPRPVYCHKRFISRLDRVRDIVMERLVKCIRINPNFIRLLRRVSLIYFRNTVYTPTIMTASILARAKKRYYAAYEYQRTSTIWSSRDAFLEYERALTVEAKIELALDPLAPGRPIVSPSPAPLPCLKTPENMSSTSSAATPRLATKPSDTPTPSTRLAVTADNKENFDGMATDTQSQTVDLTPETKAAQLARAALGIFEREYPRWQALVASEVNVERPAGLIRFEAGYVLTRVVYNGQRALSAIKDYVREVEVLEALLGQRRWRRGKRGEWYERLALILTTHLKDYERAYHVVRDALVDEDTHIIYRPKLVRRLQSLERRLDIPEAQRVHAPSLSDINEITIKGDRDWEPLSKRACSPKTPVKISDGTQQTRLIISTSKSVATAVLSIDERGVINGAKSTAKSRWFGRNNQQLTVEELALQHYESEGYKGFHCEGGLLKTIFGLLFWDILFAACPGAFETKYQNAPLDLLDDTFYFARRKEIEGRLREISEGDAPQILQRIDTAQRETKTLCIGVNWDFSREDLLEISQCINGAALASICRVFCEDYAKRMSGMPDLFLWDPIRKISLFSEVKGPNDKLAEHQKIWIDALNQAGAAVEVCHVVERNPKPKRNAKVATKRKKSNIESEDDHDVSHITKNDANAVIPRLSS